MTIQERITTLRARTGMTFPMLGKAIGLSGKRLQNVMGEPETTLSQASLVLLENLERRIERKAREPNR